MMTIKIMDLPAETKKIHESQNKWRRRNWEKTLKEHKRDIEKLITNISLFDIWKTKLQKIDVAKILIPEIFMDSYVSIHFAGYGLYKYAYMSLRSELETALRLVFFSAHPVEFKWWFNDDDDDKDWYSKTSDYPHVWGRRYFYFEHLEIIKKFEKQCKDAAKKLFGGDGYGIKGLYKELSGYIHSESGHFQTRLIPNRVSPTYDREQFDKWCYTYEKVQMYIHILLALGFAEEFKAMTPAKRDKILNVGISDDYKEEIKETLGL